MRAHPFVLAAIIILGVSALASAQTPTQTQGTTPGTTSTTGTATGTGTTTSGQTTTSTTTTTTTTNNGWLGSNDSHWIVSGFVGSYFGRQATGSNVDFGGSVGYLWNDWFGGEFLANFAPEFEVQSTAPNAFLLNGERPAINSYMANVAAAIPIGAVSSFQPFVSGGFGAITLRSDFGSNSNTPNSGFNTFNADESRFGGNIGFGALAFGGSWGVRADVRYFRAFNNSDNTIVTSEAASPATATTVNILPGLDFWRANIGVAFRW